jgi:hypothetical protein
LRFLEKTFNTATQRRISRRIFWLIRKNSQFFRLAVNRKKALTPSLIELETSKYRFWGFIFLYFRHIFYSKKEEKIWTNAADDPFFSIIGTRGDAHRPALIVPPPHASKRRYWLHSKKKKFPSTMCQSKCSYHAFNKQAVTSAVY